MKKFFGLVMVSLVIFSCSNMTKEQYLSEYKDFIQQIKENQQGYTIADWAEKDKIHSNYCDRLFKKYENELSVEEKVLLAKYRLQYDVYRYKNEAKETMLEIFDMYYSIQSEINANNRRIATARKDELIEIIDDYMENGLNEDTFFLIEQVKRVKNAFSRFLTEISIDDTIIQEE